MDDLKREADQARLAKENEEERQAELEKIYRSDIAPRLIDIHRYLVEMLKHLEEVKWIVTVEYDIPGLGKTDNFRQGDYRIYIDRHETPRKVTLQCVRAMPNEQKFTVEPGKAEELRQFLTANQVMFSDWPLRDSLGQITATVFQAKLQVRAWLSFEADIEFSRIRVYSYNFENLNHREYYFGYAVVDENWLDDLGHYLLRKRGFLGRQEMSGEARERLRQAVAKEKAQQRELEQRFILEEVPSSGIKSKPSDSGFLQVLRGRLFKPEKPN
ncbi:hypothetical protein [Methylomagnum sp.]